MGPTADELKAQANDAFKKQKFEEAATLYSGAIDVCSKGSEAAELRLSLYNNRAMASLKLKRFEQCVSDATVVLKADADNVKALFRRGQAHKALENWKQAAADLTKVIRLQPGNKQAQVELSHVQKNAAKVETARTKAVETMMKRSAGDKDSPSLLSESGFSNSKKSNKGGLVIEEVSSTKLTEDKPKPKAAPAPAKPESPKAKKSPKSTPVVPLKIGMPSVPTVAPASSTQFEAQYNRLHKYPELFAQYLRLTVPEKLPTLFKSSMTAEVLIGIVGCCLKQYLPGGEWELCLRTLSGLAQVKRLDTALMCLSKSERGDLSELLSKMSTYSWNAKHKAVFEQVEKRFC